MLGSRDMEADYENIQQKPKSQKEERKGAGQGIKDAAIT